MLACGVEARDGRGKGGDRGASVGETPQEMPTPAEDSSASFHIPRRRAGAARASRGDRRSIATHAGEIYTTTIYSACEEHPGDRGPRRAGEATARRPASRWRGLPRAGMRSPGCRPGTHPRRCPRRSRGRISDGDFRKWRRWRWDERSVAPRRRSSLGELVTAPPSDKTRGGTRARRCGRRRGRPEDDSGTGEH